MQRFDLVVVGSGLAGMSLALRVADHMRVALVTKRALTDGSSQWAQGGIAAVLDPLDSVDEHVQDTLVAGAGLCDPIATRAILDRADAVIAWLRGMEVPFTSDQDQASGLHLTREGGHSHRRIVHAADATGAAVVTTLAARVLTHPNITVFEDHIAIDLIDGRKLGHPDAGCLGAYVLDRRHDRVATLLGGRTVLATGGAGKVYLCTTNPDTATGDGIAMGWRAGCRVANMEFVQFHPTCLFHPHAKSFLITEAVRGEGGILRLPDGTRFMPSHDARAELAPRDIVARAIDYEMKKHGIDCVYLDITHQSADFITGHFPNIHQRCLELGIDITRQPIPVVPAAHFTCGGIVADVAGRTDVANLYAIGESACTGLHGANRLASNSLLECLVMADAAAADLLATQPGAALAVPDWDESQVRNADEQVVLSHNWDELRRFMWDYVGIVRTDKRLERARRRIEMLRLEIDEYYANFRVCNDLIELRNLVDAADLIVRSAQARHESRGLHYSLDWPATLADAQPTILPGRR